MISNQYRIFFFTGISDVFPRCGVPVQNAGQRTCEEINLWTAMAAGRDARSPKFVIFSRVQRPAAPLYEFEGSTGSPEISFRPTLCLRPYAK